ncbi:ABC transporter permease [Mesorhizobium sp. WSM4887]|uniref:ABC transporter permease n=1 Tax=Mesorhizobium sp. WSM4887 TaxID=3038543 RepID=UPI0024160AB0|nr:ABC transporter permease [Mesorhizobium sp. WSM4887]MDG4886829.1 ABC transporter permease [Mesorhizobium sp. WSM4887]
MASLIRRYGLGLTAILLALTAFWMLALVWIPYAIMLEQSFRLYLPVTEVGSAKDVYTIANYLSLFSTSALKTFLGVDIPLPVYIFITTVLYSIFVTAICVSLAYPLAWYLAKRASIEIVPTLLLMLVVPMFVSEFLRTYAWFVILAYQGPLNALVELFGLSKVRWLSGYNGVIVGMVYTYFLFMFFPIYNSLTSLDNNQVEAAQDLGAKWWTVHQLVVLPHAKTGISSGCTMVFMFAVGSILVPVLLGSPSSRWFTEIILRTMFESQDWNTASAYAFMLLLVCLLFVSLVMRLFRVNLSDIAH